MPKNILIVDDTPDNLRLLTGILDNEGYDVRAAPSGARALAAVEKKRPDMILLDILMPGMDGYEVCERLKSDSHTRDIPIIFISALDQVFDKVKAFELGAVDYINKPFHRQEVLARVNNHVSLNEMQRTLQEQNEQLTRQNAELDAFAHTVAHDLKNPLSVILGYAFMLNEDTDSMTVEELLMTGQNIERNAQKAVSIVESLLLLASVRKEDIEPEPIHMGAILYQAKERLQLLADEHDATITLQEAWPTALGYGPWIEEVWINYLSNSIKYGGPSPDITCGSDTLPDGMLRFWVHDHGPGIPLEQQRHLFTEFSRLSELDIEGHGMGLSIVRRIVTKLGGEIGVESSPGEGSLFYFTLHPLE